MRMDISVHLRSASTRLPLSSTEMRPKGRRQRPPRLIIDFSPVTHEPGGSRTEKKEKKSLSARNMLTSCPRCQATFPCSPGPSPSVPLSFVLGGGGASGVATPGRPAVTAGGGADSSEQDLRLRVAMLRLQASGWYHEGLTRRQADALLAGCSPGTFLLRDSANPRFLLSLSSQTHNGPTSVRLHYTEGYFRMDAESSLIELMPLFECVVDLMEYYIALTGRLEGLRRKEDDPVRKWAVERWDPVWLDSVTGQMHGYIDLKKPLYRTDKFPTLQHLARLAVNKLPQHSLPTSALPHTLREYLAEYPYVH